MGDPISAKAWRSTDRPPTGELAKKGWVIVSSGCVLLTALWSVSTSLAETTGTWEVPNDALWEKRTFWRWSVYDRTVRYETTATLVKVSAHAYWYIEEVLTNRGENYTSAQMDEMSVAFDSQIMPRIADFYGNVPLPPADIDGDPRITILIYDDVGVSYFDPRNQAPAGVDPTSNEREMVYIDFKAGSYQLLSSIAHEVVHLVHWNYQRSCCGDWLEEGLAWLGSELAGFPDYVVADLFMEDPGTGFAGSRGAGHLFAKYLFENFGGANVTRGLTRDQGGPFQRIRNLLEARGVLESVGEIVRDWVITNLVNGETDAGERFQYAGYDGRAAVALTVGVFPWSGSIQGLKNGGAVYIELSNLSEGGLKIVLESGPSDGISVILIGLSDPGIQVIEHGKLKPKSSAEFPIRDGFRFTLAFYWFEEDSDTDPVEIPASPITILMNAPDIILLGFLAVVAILLAGVIASWKWMRRRKTGRIGRSQR